MSTAGTRSSSVTAMTPDDGRRRSRIEIEDALRSYCRGIDRLDGAAVAAAFHAGAQLVDYGPEPMSIEAFVEHALPSLERYAATQHRLSNTMIEFGGDDQALVESYVLAFHVERPEHVEPHEAATRADRLHTFNGRYIDRFERRDGRWAIGKRTLRVDWTRVEHIDATMGDRWVPSGRAGAPDPLTD